MTPENINHIIDALVVVATVWIIAWVIVKG